MKAAQTVMNLQMKWILFHLRNIFNVPSVEIKKHTLMVVNVINVNNYFFSPS